MPKENHTELAAAALALDEELRRFDELAASAAKMRLNTQRNLDRALEALARAGESQDKISAHVAHLVQAVAAARQKQEREAAILIARGEELAKRRLRYGELLQRMAALGGQAKEIQELLVAAKSKEGALDEVTGRMEKTAGDAENLARDAFDDDMEDLARQADSLRQQLVSAKNKLSLLARRGKN